ncbi:hypothetical protein ACFX2H_036202 [Malus domestica]
MVEKMVPPQNLVEEFQARFKELQVGVMRWLTKQSLPVEAAVVTLTSGTQIAAISAFMVTPTNDVSSSLPTHPSQTSLNPQAMASFKQAQALAGGPLVQARNFANYHISAHIDSSSHKLTMLYKKKVTELEDFSATPGIPSSNQAERQRRIGKQKEEKKKRRSDGHDQAVQEK